MRQSLLLIIILAAPLAASALLFAWRRAGARAAGWIASAASLLSLAATLALLPELERGTTPAFALSWIPAARIQVRLQLDWLAFPFLLTEAAVTAIAIVYAWGYHHPDERTPRFYALLLLFAVGMAGTTLADDLFLFYTFWELMLIASCVLIAVWGEGERRGAVALKYFIFTHLGSLMVLVGLVLLYDIGGSASLSALRAGVSLPTALIAPVIALFLVGFAVKMAIFPVHLWLPDAHTVAPMPVTIMLAAAMLSMGAYGIVRFPMSMFTLAQVSPFGLPMMIAGLVSEVYGALMALAEQDIKRIIAYSSVSQMGYVLLGLGTLTHDGIAGATLHVIFHAIVKALLFMCAGLIIRATGRRELPHLGGLGKALPLAAVCAIAGTPPFVIFDSEWLIFAGAFDTAHIGLAMAALFGSLLTVAYALWFFGRIFLGRPRGPSPGAPASRLPWAMTVPTVLLAALTLIEGVFPAPVYGWVFQELALLFGGRL